MRRSFYRKPLQQGSFPIPDKRTSNLQVIREKILNSVLVVTLLLGLVALIIAIPARVQKNQYWLVVGFVLTFVWVFVVTISRKIPFTFRSVSLIGAILFLGITTLILDGLEGNGRLFLLVVPIISSIFLSSNKGFLSLILVWILLGVLGFLDSSYFFTTILKIGPLADSTSWLVASVVFILVSGTLYGIMRSMLAGLFGLLDSENELKVDLDAERSQLERRVQIRTQHFESRLNQTHTACEIVNDLYTVLHPDEIMIQSVDLLKENFDLYYVGIFELTDSGDRLELKSGTGDEGFQMVVEKFFYQIDSNSLVSWSINNRKSRFASDVGPNPVQFTYPLLPETHSELVIPILGNNPKNTAMHRIQSNGSHSFIGALSILSTKVMAFNQEDITLFQLIADGLGRAIEIARRNQQLKSRYIEMENINRQYLRDSWFKMSGVHGVLSQISEDASQERMAGRESTYALPLVLRDQVIGLLSLEGSINSNQSVELADDDRKFVESVLVETALALENVRLLEETQIRANNEHILSELSRLAHTSSDLESILKMVVKELGLRLGASEALIELDVPKVNPSH